MTNHYFSNELISTLLVNTKLHVEEIKIIHFV